ncbi:hypothetical protein GPALN_003430 [Globodera pallida]|nr:hypothetical protein GPALN_003430 [Globodera pallida]
MAASSRLILIVWLLPLASVVWSQCPYQGWTVSGSCQMTGYCLDPREQCFSSSVCCRISDQQYTPTTKQNPKTGVMETNYCPIGSYRDRSCTTFCWTPNQVCVNKQDCCVKTNIPTMNNNNNPYNPGTRIMPTFNVPGWK